MEGIDVGDVKASVEDKEIDEVVSNYSLNKLGSLARDISNNYTGNRVFYSELFRGDINGEINANNLEVLSSDYTDTVNDSSISEKGIDVVVDEGDLTVENHRELHDRGLETDLSLSYSSDLSGFRDELTTAWSLINDSSGVRAVSLSRAGGRSTAYRDLWVVVLARIYLDAVEFIRLDRRSVDGKLAQTSMEYGVNDLGFMDWFDEFDVDLVIREAGFEAVNRRGVSS